MTSGLGEIEILETLTITSGGDEIAVKSVDELPAGEFHVTGISLRGHRELVDDQLILLARLPRLSRLDLTYTGVTEPATR